MWSLALLFLPGMTLPDAPDGFSAGAAVDRTLAVREQERSYRVYLPRGWSGASPAVFVFHGEGGSADTVQKYARFEPIADEEGFVVVYPQGIGRNWDYAPGSPVVRSRGFGALYSKEGTSAETDERFDDVALVRSIVDELSDRGVIDPGRVFATGISSGAMFCHRLAAEASDVVAGIAPVSGGMSEPVASRFDPKFPVSLVAIIGNDDPLMPATGGPIAPILPQDRGRVAPVEETIARYLELDGISGEPNVDTLPDGPEDDGTTTRVYRYPPGEGGTLVTIYRIDGAGHNWPGRPLNYHVQMVGKASQDFDGSVAIWDFFEQCPPRRVVR
ncbi:alpha/beta hydrolase family esterase [Tautonia plasticadhaerens]|uniref:Esterase PHB depolymerase n=1 Tax=Tautonia plasticadhaerens TaxID=2527974 RepID=A0A518H6Q1_9BACT|nr:PHB depolymerase family esterase [Tautonia plasticadhaerens]QDV36485.1 Esterase PHB depolymerase [Tautonia plasticadhaerens]